MQLTREKRSDRSAERGISSRAAGKQLRGCRPLRKRIDVQVTKPTRRTLGDGLF